MSFLKPYLLTKILYKNSFDTELKLIALVTGFIRYLDCTDDHNLAKVPDWQDFQIVFGDYFSDSIVWYAQANLSFGSTLKAP